MGEKISPPLQLYNWGGAPSAPPVPTPMLSCLRYNCPQATFTSSAGLPDTRHFSLALLFECFTCSFSCKLHLYVHQYDIIIELECIIYLFFWYQRCLSADPKLLLLYRILPLYSFFMDRC